MSTRTVTTASGRPDAAPGQSAPAPTAVGRHEPDIERDPIGERIDDRSQRRSSAPESGSGPTRDASGGGVQRWIAVLSLAVVLAWLIQLLVPNRADTITAFSAPDWLPLAAAGFAAAGIMPLIGPRLWLRVRPLLRWTALLLMVWTASGLPFDLLTAAGLIGHRTADGEVVMSTVYWPALTTRACALVAVIALARLTLAQPVAPASTRPPAWFGYLAFVLALPYPVLRVHWALGGTLGLLSPGGAGTGWEPVLIAIPWAVAAILSLALAAPPSWMPRRLLLAAGWSATAIVAIIGPAAFWGLVSAVASGGDLETGDISLWVFGLFYGSWFLWAIAGGAATRAYQLRGAPPAIPSPA